jgi:hypothetical membrane protein
MRSCVHFRGSEGSFLRKQTLKRSGYLHFQGVKSLSESEKSFRVRFGGVAGILTPVFAFTFIGLAIASYPQFSWLNNALSDLGVVPGITSTLFNFGLFVSGLFSFNFALGLFKFLGKNITGKIGAIILLLASLSLMGIGITPENIRPFHYIFSVAFFSLVPISLLVIASYFLITRQKPMAAFTLLIAILAAAPWVLFIQIHYVQGVAIPELLSALASALWAVVIGWKMFKVASHPKSS